MSLANKKGERMAVPATVDEFIDLVRKSGVADEKRLDAYLARMRAAMPADPPKAAGLFVHNGILTNFQAENILAGKWRRFSIGKYKVLERLGSGGFAQVYLCEHKLMRRRVAVKVLPIAKAKDSSALERFYREARAVAALDHPNIVHAYDIDQDDDLHFLVMEYVDGANLQEIVKKSGPLGVVRACHYIRQAALALQHAHENGLVHRDIKPGNILVDRTGVVKILDMGLALFFHDEDDQLTKKHDDGTLGTADYLSPEQAMDAHEVDIRTDIYSLGVTFYFLLTGRAPFEGVPVAQKLLAHQLKQPKPVAEYRKDVPAGVLSILERMMAKNADERFAAPGDVADALGPFTQVAIAPPAEAEMPKLSPAATGQQISDADTTVGKNDTPMAPARTHPNASPEGSVSVAAATPPSPPPLSPGGRGARTEAGPASRPNQGASNIPSLEPTATVAMAPLPLPPTAAADAPHDGPWEAFATDGLASSTDAARPSGCASLRTRKAPFASKTNPILIILLVMAFVIIPLLLTAVIGGLIWFFYPTSPLALKSGPPKLEVSRDGKRPNSYTSIQAAVRSAPTGATIELWDDIYEENVVIERGSSQRTNFTLQPALGKEITWRSARSDAKQPILMLRKAIEFTLNGKGITFDGILPDKKGTVNNLIEISFESPGLIVQDAQFNNFAHSAIFLINAAGSASQPIKLHRLATESSAKTRAAIYFDANPNVLPPVNSHIEIQNCDFRGTEIGKAIQFKQLKGKTVFGDNVRWPGR
jgi:serine/threonine protein kinase